MIYRVLGVAALVVGAIFGVVALLVLLPFFNTFSTSLLILAAVFAVFAYVFLAVGWQLFHPPASRRWAGHRGAEFGAVGPENREAELPGVQFEQRPGSMEAVHGREVLTPEPETVIDTAPLEHREPEPELIEPIAVLAPADPTPPPATTFAGFGEPHPIRDSISAAPGETRSPVEAEGNGEKSGNGHGPGGRPIFKKRGAPVSERSETHR